MERDQGEPNNTFQPPEFRPIAFDEKTEKVILEIRKRLVEELGPAYLTYPGNVTANTPVPGEPADWRIPEGGNISPLPVPDTEVGPVDTNEEQDEAI